ncbi:MAG: VWA domain-containing protein [Candidatus Binatus sp.]|uniref:VWA domain-containing protein n=1 Tax=Candidatus Binatus sp. TaxID=2811406 RepID=UPI00271F4D33|nr:VWA domain-containing protein [Candidatus Binatus sp.]MDO8430862.1 VWA domain-containing protein [Candidatus Binatus sp.]
MAALRDQLIKLIGELRSKSVRISVAESIDAMNAVAAAGLERSRMREALAAALIKDEADRAIFDECFARFFAMPARPHREHPDSRGAQVSAAAGRGHPGENPSLNEDASPRRAEHPSEQGAQLREQAASNDAKRKASSKVRERDGDKGEVASNEHRGDTARDAHDGDGVDARGDSDASRHEAARLTRLREIERKPFDTYLDLDYDEARRALEPLIRRFRIRLGRRLRLARAGRIDFRRTIRAGLQHGGALAELKFRARRPRHVDLAILADVSGSVRYAAQLMLELMAGARGCFRRVASFVYVDHLAEADFEQGHLVMTPALDMYARSDFGRVLGELWARRLGLITRATIVVIMGDGRNNRLPARADVLREISRSCRALVWLNPEDPARWGTGDSAIKQYAREVSLILPARNLRELQQGLERIA